MYLRGNMISDECVLIVFSKAPVAGEVKTRLIPALGETAATELYQDLVTSTLTTARQTNIVAIQLWCSPDIKHPFFDECTDNFNITLHSQEGDNLGERMYLALCTALDRYSHALLIGCDCPQLSASDLVLANNKLVEGYDVVLGPAEDGGYYLIGAKLPHQELFSGMDWGSGTVLSKTRECLKGLDLEYFELEEKWDLDRPEDLLRYRSMTADE